MRSWVAIAVAGILLGGCAPKMGEDIIIEPVGNVRLENSGADVMFGVLALLGAPVDKGEIRIGTDLKVINKWHSGIKVISIIYRLSDEKEEVAHGEAKASEAQPILIGSGETKTVPLVLKIDPGMLKNTSRLFGTIRSEHKWFVKADAVIEVWGIQKHYLIEKEATKVIQKAFKGVAAA
ncbi:MAG: hypothetical protein AB7U44_01980 [Sulfuricurvum sp.]